MNKINGNCNILGGVVSIGFSEKSTFGNGTGSVHYSPQILDNLVDYCTNLKKKLSEQSWQEKPCD
jgi:hypothetical protein